MPELDFALLCDYVRAEPAGVAHVIAAGVDTVYPPQVPSGQNIGVLVRLTFTRNECDRPHRIEIFFQDLDGNRLVQISGTAQAQWQEGLPTGWRQGVFLAFNMGIPLPAYSQYSFEILVNDQSVKTLNLWVAPPKAGHIPGLP
jgi:hypothetical protein